MAAYQVCLIDSKFIGILVNRCTTNSKCGLKSMVEQLKMNNFFHVKTKKQKAIKAQ